MQTLLEGRAALSHQGICPLLKEDQRNGKRQTLKYVNALYCMASKAMELLIPNIPTSDLC